MRLLIWCVILGVALWSGYWYIASTGVDRGLDAWLKARAAEGWQAEGTVTTAGYPTRFETVVTDLALADPETGLAWRAPEVRLSAATWAPTAIEAQLPRRHVVSSPYERIEITSDDMTAALSVEAGPDLALIASNVSLRDVGLASTAGWTAALGTGRLATSRADDDPLSHDIIFDANDLRPAADAKGRLDPTGRLPEVFDEMSLRASVGFDAPWDRHAIEDRRPQITALDLGHLTARWGDLEIEAAGAVTVDAQGIPEGRITVRAVNWREMVAIGRASGLIPEAIAPTVEAGLGVLAGLGGNAETIDAPLSFQNGFVSFGPIPLGPAPRLTIR